MKKILAVLCVIFAAIFVCSCKIIDPVGVEEEVSQYSYETDDPSDFNSDGSFILQSNNDRYVYKMDFNQYVVFKFSGSAVSSVEVIADFETEDKATEYLQENIITLMDSGDYHTVTTNGRYVIYSIPLENEKYGKYYKLSRTSVEEDFAGYEKG